MGLNGWTVGRSATRWNALIKKTAREVGKRLPSYTVSELSQRPPCPLRIMSVVSFLWVWSNAYNVPRFAPLDIPSPETVDDLLELYNHYSMPDAFVSERLHHVAHSFGALEAIAGFNCKSPHQREF